MEIAAQYFDGRATRGVPVSAHVHAAGLVLSGLETPLSFPLSQLRLAPRVGRSARSVSLPNGARCVDPTNALVDRIELYAAPRFHERLVRHVESSALAQMVAVVALSALSISGLRWGIPGVAGFLVDNTPAKIAHQVGKGVLTVLDEVAFEPSRLTPEQQAPIHVAFGELKDAHPELPLELVFRSGAPPNAFALPDGTVIMTDALVELAARNQQLVGVLAHEVGHVQHRHSLKGLLEGSASALLVALYLTDASQVGDWAAWLPTAVVGARYSRQQEAEADEFARQYLARSGVQSYHMADLFRALQRGRGESDAVSEYLASHPAAGERIESFERSAAQPPDPLAREVARHVAQLKPNLFRVNHVLIERLLAPNPDSNLLFLMTRTAGGGHGMQVAHISEERTRRRDEFDTDALRRFGVALTGDTEDRLAALGADIAAQYRAARLQFLRWYVNDINESVPLLLGIQPGDVVQRINGKAITHPEDARAILRKLEPDSKVEVQLLRENDPLVIEYSIY